MATPGGAERPSEAVELLRDCSGEGMRPSLLLDVSEDSAIATEGAKLSAGCVEMECVLLAMCRSMLPTTVVLKDACVSSQASSNQ